MLKRTKPATSAPKPENLRPFYRILAFAVAWPIGRSPAVSAGTPAPVRQSPIRASGQNEPVNLARVAWLLTVIGCLVAVIILAFDGYLGYAAVTLAVALSAAINVT